MSKQTVPSDYFVAGGTLRPDAPSYVKRTADDELFKLALAGKFCYVLTPRQMGKSSLMIRVAQQLQKQNISTAIIDLTNIGCEIGIDQWYLGLLTRLKKSLRLTADPVSWWQQRASLGYIQRFTDFLRYVVLEEIDGHVVIFIDEIDTTLRLGFRDDFFAAIRAMYNARAEDAQFERLTFVLLGVVSPPELIKDSTRTPFNVGFPVVLKEFTKYDASVLQDGLEAALPGQGRRIFDRIYYWTNGHPYLTQKMCLTVTDGQHKTWSNDQIDDAVRKLFLSEEARRETNLQFVQEKILKHPQQKDLLALYGRVLRGRKVCDDGQSPVQNQLKLSGLVKEENGYLRIHNEIYRQAFGSEWLRKHTSINWALLMATVAVTVASLAIGLLLYDLSVDIRFSDCAATFYQARTHEERLESLAEAFRLRPLFGPSDYSYRAIDWFYGLSAEDQLALFRGRQADERDLIVVVKRIYLTLADVESTDGTSLLLDTMSLALKSYAGNDEARRLVQELDAWHTGRDAIKHGRYQTARDAYNQAIALNGENLATRFERATVLTQLGEYDLALEDLELVMSIARKGPQPTPTPALTATFSPTVQLLASSTVSMMKEGTSVPISTKIPTGKTALPTGSLTSTRRPSVTPSFSTPTHEAIITPLATPIPKETSISAGFTTFSQILIAVRNLINTNSGLLDALLRNPFVVPVPADYKYPNLGASGLVPTSTPQPVVAIPTKRPPTATSTLLPPFATMSASTPTAKATATGQGEPEQIIRVAQSGTDTVNCGSEELPCQTIQYAIDQSTPGAEVRVAEGTYTLDPPNNSCESQVGAPAVVCIQDHLTLIGGFSVGNWSVADPASHITSIDGQNQYCGVIVRSKGNSVDFRMEGFTIKNGLAQGFGAEAEDEQPPRLGGGMFVDFGYAATSTNRIELINLVYENNKAIGKDLANNGGDGYGGGLALRSVNNAELQDLTFLGNVAQGGNGTEKGGYGVGGALYVSNSDITISNLTLISNTAASGNSSSPDTSGSDIAYAMGGGVGFQVATVQLLRVFAEDNRAIGGSSLGYGGAGAGGAISGENGNLVIRDGDMRSNLAIGGEGQNGGLAGGGGIHLTDSKLSMERTWMISNAARGGPALTNTGDSGPPVGGALHAIGYTENASVEVHNCVIADNWVEYGNVGGTGIGGGGGGFWLQAVKTDVFYSTFAHNRLEGSLLYGNAIAVLGPSTEAPAIQVKDSIIAEHGQDLNDFGAVYAGDGIVILDRTLWAGNTRDFAQGEMGNISDLNPVRASSAEFVAPGPPSYDYHILESSPARNKGGAEATGTDIDGDLRNTEEYSDIGADEYVPEQMPLPIGTVPPPTVTLIPIPTFTPTSTPRPSPIRTPIPLSTPSSTPSPMPL